MVQEAFAEGAPSCLLPWAEFVALLRRTGAKINRKRGAQPKTVCTNQNVMSQEILDIKGAMCQW